MAASESLNPQQFAVVAHVLNYQSSDAKALGAGDTVRDAMENKAGRIDHPNSSYGPEFKNAIAKGTITPITVTRMPTLGKTYLSDGHHRVTEAHRQGQTVLPKRHEDW